MKIIFLDVDGVLNSMTYIEQKEKEIEANLGYIDESTIKHLARIVEETGAKIVLSSSWRSMFDQNMHPAFDAAAELIRLLEKYNLALISKTEHIGSRRGDEVREWLNRHPNVSNFVILDDAPFPDWNELTKNWVKTSFTTGLTDEDATKAIAILER